MANNVPVYNTTTSSIAPATYDVPSKIPANTTELSATGLPPGSHRFMIGLNASPAALADAVIGANPHLQGAQAHYMANAAKNYGALEPGMIVEFKPSEQIIGRQGQAALQRAAKAYEALKQLERETGTTRLSPRDQARINAEMRAIHDEHAEAPRSKAQAIAVKPMQHESATVAPSPLRAVRAAAPTTTHAALTPPHSRFGDLRPTPGFKVTAPTLFGGAKAATSSPLTS